MNIPLFIDIRCCVIFILSL